MSASPFALRYRAWDMLADAELLVAARCRSLTGEADIMGLDHGTAYSIYVVARDAHTPVPNVQPTATETQFTTLPDASAPQFRAGYEPRHNAPLPQHRLTCRSPLHAHTTQIPCRCVVN